MMTIATMKPGETSELEEWHSIVLSWLWPYRQDGLAYGDSKNRTTHVVHSPELWENLGARKAAVGFLTTFDIDGEGTARVVCT